MKHRVKCLELGKAGYLLSLIYFREGSCSESEIMRNPSLEM